MAGQVPYRHPVMANQLGKAHHLLSVYGPDTQANLHHQRRRRLLPPDQESNQNQGAFTSDMALQKLVYLATRNIEKKRKAPLQNWALTVQQLAIKFGDRLTLDLGHSPAQGLAPEQD